MTITLFEAYAAPTITATHTTHRSTTPTIQRDTAVPRVAGPLLITIAQRSLIVSLLNEKPWRVQMIEVVTGALTEEKINYAAVFKFISHREAYLYGFKEEAPAAVAEARRTLLYKGIPALYALHLSAMSHTMTRWDASYFIDWLSGKRDDWMLHYPNRLDV